MLNGHSTSNGIERATAAYATIVHAKPPISSIVKNSPFIINNNFHNHNRHHQHSNSGDNTQRRNTFDGGSQLDQFKKATTTAHIKSGLISSKIKQYCDSTSGGEQLKNNQYTTNNYHSYMNKKNLANHRASGGIFGSGNVGVMSTMKSTMTAASSMPAIATMTTTTTTTVVSATKRLANGNRIVAPSHNYSNTALQDEDLFNIDVKNLVSTFLFVVCFACAFCLQYLFLFYSIFALRYFLIFTFSNCCCCAALLQFTPATAHNEINKTKQKKTIHPIHSLILNH